MPNDDIDSVGIYPMPKVRNKYTAECIQYDIGVLFRDAVSLIATSLWVFLSAWIIENIF
jgi:hypothetical protein